MRKIGLNEKRGLAVQSLLVMILIVTMLVVLLLFFTDFGKTLLGIAEVAPEFNETKAREGVPENFRYIIKEDKVQFHDGLEFIDLFEEEIVLNDKRIDSETIRADLKSHFFNSVLRAGAERRIDLNLNAREELYGDRDYVDDLPDLDGYIRLVSDVDGDGLEIGDVLIGLHDDSFIGAPNNKILGRIFVKLNGGASFWRVNENLVLLDRTKPGSSTQFGEGYREPKENEALILERAEEYRNAPFGTPILIHYNDKDAGKEYSESAEKEMYVCSGLKEGSLIVELDKEVGRSSKCF